MPGGLLVVVATGMEGSLLGPYFARLPDAGRLIVTGVGPVNAAHAVTMALVADRPSALVVCGVAGAYPGAGLQVGDVVTAAEECYGDLGASSPSGFLDMEALGFPVIAGPPPIYNRLPLQIFPTARTATFVTVSTCTGTAEAARAIAARTGGAVENMEGAAVAHVARLHAVPAGEVRGISNMVTDRDTRGWRLREAAVAAQEALLQWIAQR